MNQREAVEASVISVLGEIHGAVTLSSDQKKQVHEECLRLFLSGQVDLRSAEARDEVWLRRYIPGLVNNWCRKSPALNGNTVYHTKNPGIRQNSGDAQLKNLKLLKEQLVAQKADPETIKLVEAKIAERQEQLKPEPKKIDIAALPPELRSLVRQ